MISIATFAPSLLLITVARCAALWSAVWTSLDYKGRHAGNVAQSTAGLRHCNMCCECSSCVTSRHRTPAAAWTSRPMRGSLLLGAVIGLGQWVLAGSGSLCHAEEGEGAAAYQTKEYTPPGLACVGREVEESVQHCAKPVFYLSTWGKSRQTNENSVLLI